MAIQTWTALYNSIRDTGIAKRGSAGQISATGGALPRTTLDDAMDILTGLHPELVSVLKHLASPEHAVIEDWTDIGATEDAAPTISIEAWLLCKPVDGGDGSVRAMPAPGILSQQLAAQGIQWTAGVRYKLSSRRSVVLTQVASKRDRLYTIVAEATAARHLWMTDPELRDFYKALYAFLIALQQGRETPTPGLWERVKGGIRYAVVETKNWARDEAVPAISEAAGSLLADAGTAVGKGLGAGAKGFFEQAGLTAYIVVALGLVFVLR